MITQERIGELENWFRSETINEKTQEWRNDLTDKEVALVSEWDFGYNVSMGQIAEAILAAQEKRNAI